MRNKSMHSEMAEENNFEYFGSYTSERYTQEHYYLTEFWLWKTKGDFIGLFFVYGGLGGDGPVKPMIVVVDDIVNGSDNKFILSASSFKFVGRINENTIVGNLTNGSENWDGGEETTTFVQGSNTKTVKNLSASLKKTEQQWQQWVNTLDPDY